MTEHNSSPESSTASNTATANGLASLRRLLPFVFFIVVVGFAIGEVRGLDIHGIRSALQALTPAQLLGIQGAALAGILLMGLYDWLAARVFAIALAPGTIVRIAWIANTFNNLVGMSGLAGSGLRILLLGGEGVDNRKALSYSSLIMLSVPSGLAVLCWPLLLSGGPAADKLPIPLWLAWLALSGFALYLPVYVVLLRRGALARLFSGFAAQDAPVIAGMLLISALDWLLAALTIWLALSFSGTTLPWPQFIAAFIIASTLGILSFIPGGLGVFDSALLVLLTPLAASPEPLVSGIVLYRVCYYLIPWLIAVYLGADRLTLPKFWQKSAAARQWRESRIPSLLRLPLNVLSSVGVRVMSYLTFGGGLVLLISAAFPALRDRLTVLHNYVPLAAIEISHLLSVAAGVLLIALSRGIAEQVRSAYQLTQVLLLGGALFSLLKGIDYEEAVVLLGVALLLRRQRQRFYRDSYPLFSPRTLLWFAGLLLSVIGYAWLGDWVHGDIPLGWERLSHFAPLSEAPRFARGLLIAGAAAVVFIGWTFFRSPKVAPPRPDAMELAAARAVLDSHGGSEFAHLIYLGDKYLFWSDDRRAFIQYGRIRDRLVALGDPCGDPAVFDDLIIAFRDYADRYNLSPCFYEVNESLMHHYHDAGFALFKLGEAAIVDLAQFTTAGKRGEALRHSVNRARRGGAACEILAQPLADDTWRQLRQVSDTWLAERRTAEKGFSLGAYHQDYLRQSPVAVVRVNDRIVAFANLMPDYGSHQELSIDLMRHVPEAPPGTMDYLFVELLQYAQAQGYRYFNLGMAPLGGVGAHRYARAGERVARLAYEYGNRFYNYKGLRGFKEKFHPQWRSAYLAYPMFSALPLLLIDSAALIAGGYRAIFRGK